MNAKFWNAFWNDESGIVALEYLLVATVIGLALITGLTSFARALNVELIELGQAVLGLSQGYTIEGTSGCAGSKAGSAVSDTAGTLTFVEVPVTPTSINVTACP